MEIEINVNKEQLDKLGRDLEERKRQAEDIKTSIAGWKKEIEDAYRELDNLKAARKGASQEQVAEINKQINQLQIDNGGRQAKINDASKKLSGLEGEIEDILSKMKELGGGARSAGDAIKDAIGKKAGDAIGNTATKLAGKSGLMKAVNAVAGAFGGWGKIAVAALAAIGTYVGKWAKRVIGEVKAVIKSYFDLQKAIKAAGGEAAKESLTELRRLDELKEKLESAAKGTAQYVDARNELIQQYGKYDRYLKEEIDRVGNLSLAYDKLRVAIIETNLERQKEAVRQKNDDAMGQALSGKFQRLYSKTRRRAKRAGVDVADAWDEVYNIILNGGEPSSELIEGLLGSAPARGGRRVLRRWKRRDEKANRILPGNGQEKVADDTVLREAYELSRTAENQRLALNRRQVDIINEGNQLAINAMQDGFAKQRKQAKLNYDMQLQDLDDWGEQYKKAQEENRKQLWMAEHNGSLNGWLYSYQEQEARREDQKTVAVVKSRREELLEKAYKQELAALNYNQYQQMAASYGTTEQKRNALQKRFDWEDSSGDVMKQFADRAKKVREYEFAQFDYETIQRYGTQDQIRKALEDMLKAEIETLDEAEKPAAKARMAVTLAEFDAGLAGTYGGRKNRRDALEAQLNAELQTIDEKYRDIKAASDKVKLAEFDLETAEQYGTRSERRMALQAVLDAKKNEYVKKNGTRDSARIDAANAFELAKFDWEEVADFGSYDAMLNALRKKWQAQIALLPEDLREGATRKMNKEILDLEIANSEEYRRIFTDADSMTKQTLNDTIQYAEALLQAKIAAGATVEEVKALRDQINNLREASDKISYSGWGGTLQGIIQARSRRNQSRDTLVSLGQRAAEMRRRARTIADPTGSKVELTQEWKDLQVQIKAATDASKKWDAEMKKEAATLIATNLGGLLSQVGSALSEIASISGDANMSNLAEGFSEIGGVVSNIAQGFATGGLLGGIATAISTFASKIIEAFTSVAVADAKYEKFVKDFKNELDFLDMSVREKDYSHAFGVDDYQHFTLAFGKMTTALNKFVDASYGLKTMDVKTKDFSWWTNLFRGDEFKNIQSFDIWGDDGLLDVDKASAFLDVCVQLTDEQRAEIENAIKLKDTYDELVKTTQDFVNSLTGDVTSNLAADLVDNFAETGRVIFSAGKYLNTFNKNLATSIVKSMLLKQVFTDEENEKIAQLIANGDATGAIQKYNKLLGKAEAMVPQIETFLKGVNLDEYSNAKGSRGDYQNITETTGSAIEGRLTSLQISSEVRNQALTLTNTTLAEMLKRQLESITIADEARSIQAQSYLALVQIRDNTDGNLKAVKDIQDKITNIEKHTRNL